MKKLALCILVLGALGGCVVYPAPYDGGYHRPHYGQRDRDGDGVPNRFDRRPDNPYRY